MKQLEAIKKAYEEAGYDNPDIIADVDFGYLTLNTARNGRDVVWYLDECNSIAVYVDTCEILSIEEMEDVLE